MAMRLAEECSFFGGRQVFVLDGSARPDRGGVGVGWRGVGCPTFRGCVASREGCVLCRGSCFARCSPLLSFCTAVTGGGKSMGGDGGLMA